MPHFECGAFNHSATSPEPKTGLKRPRMDGRYVTKHAKTDKGRPGILHHHRSTRPRPVQTMFNALKLDLRKELHGVLMTLGLLAILTAVLFALVWGIGLAHGSVVFLIPVVIAAARWGIVSAV